MALSELSLRHNRRLGRVSCGCYHKHVPEPTFAQPERRSFLVPVLLALAALGVAIALAMHFFPATTVDIDHIHTDILPTDTVMKSSVIGAGEHDLVLFVASTIRVDNQLRVPIYIEDFHLTLTNTDDAELTESASRDRDLPELETTFPGLKPMLAHPLPRNTVLNPNTAAQGTVLFALKIPKETWDQRKSAVIKVDLYHQPSIYATIPKS
jgi:hypothetical protein